MIIASESPRRTVAKQIRHVDRRERRLTAEGLSDRVKRVDNDLSGSQQEDVL